MGGLSAQQFFFTSDQRFWDTLFPARDRLGFAPPIDPRIVLVPLDNDLFELIGQPFSRWADDYALGFERLFESGARAVAFDIIFHPRLEKMPTRDLEVIEDEILEFATLALEHDLVVVEGYRASETPLRSVDLLHFAADSQSNVATNNLLTDTDGKVRSLALFFRDDSSRGVSNLAVHLARLATVRPFEQVEGRVGDLFGEQEQRLRINYATPPETGFRTLPFSVLLKGGSWDLKDSICLVGPVYDGSNDLHNTSWGQRFGVEIHAAALNTILTERYLKPCPDIWHILLAVAGSLLGHAMSFRGNLLRVLATLLGTILAIWVLCLAFFISLGLLLPVSGLVLGLTGASSGVLVYRYLTIERARKHIKAVLGRFVSPQVMTELLSDPSRLALGGSRRRITVLFADINGFTSLSESKTPEEVIVMLNDFFQEMVAIIFAHGGTIKQFVGDEIMVIFGAPEPQQDHALRAVKTAQKMRDRLRELKDSREPESGFYEVKIGIHTGEVVVGNVGSEQRSEYAAVGDNVNLAARIMGLAGLLEEVILISDETRMDASKFLEYETRLESLGVHSFKGRKEQMEVFAVR